MVALAVEIKRLLNLMPSDASIGSGVLAHLKIAMVISVAELFFLSKSGATPVIVACKVHRWKGLLQIP